ncbi:YebG family protein [Colwellia sp. E2M01]|uniref:YebG family protein n=1 Tax=Colwellia sp. E2M01 TaxID=2841561 RepID=UPI001C093666|nr:YebG family protein [Colwellia sp. E2M01]MBU2872040.1 YebG family protein [Colwellia sp. E2M01]
MAVESRFVVIRNGVEAKTFMDKKSADEYDKMLDMADNLSQMFTQSTVELSDSANEELSIFLAQHREEVLIALLAKKAPAKKTPAKKSASQPIATTVEQKTNASSVGVVDIEEQKMADKSTEKAVPKAKKSRAKVTEEKLSEAG